ncbi:MAG: putative FMN/FAD exporter YeeO [Myxococcota bacterium]|nr:putative FMN/FAD exporter YeeO [Myxococcota bacterium]
MVVGLLSITLMEVTDTILMGRVSTSAQAAVALSGLLIHTITLFFRGLVTGGETLVAAADGAGDEQRKHQAAGAGVWLGMVTGLAASVMLIAVAPWVIAWSVPDQEMAGRMASYLSVRVFAVPFVVMGFGVLAGLQGVGDSKSRMWGGVAGNAVNALAALVLIFGWGPFPRLEEVGAAIANILGSITMLVIYGWRYIHLFKRVATPSRALLRDVLTVGLPFGIQMLLGVLAFSVMNMVLSSLGPVQLAASQIVINIISVSFLPGWGIGEAAGILVGRYLGAGKPETAHRSLVNARWLAVMVMGAWGVVFLFAGNAVVGFFSDDPAVLEIAAVLIRMAAFFQMLDALAMVHLSVLRGAGDTRWSMIVHSSMSWMVTVPAAFLLARGLGWGAPGAWMGLTVELLLLSAITFWRTQGIRNGKVGRLDLLLGQEGAAAMMAMARQDEKPSAPSAAVPPALEQENAVLALAADVPANDDGEQAKVA